MILLDTHVWVWWVHDADAIPAGLRADLELSAEHGFAVSAISCWEVAKLVERGRMELPSDIHDWFDLALDRSGVSVIALSPAIALASTTLPTGFHRDPADQIIVATSRVHDLPLATCDEKIRAWNHVRLLDEGRIHDR